MGEGSSSKLIVSSLDSVVKGSYWYFLGIVASNVLLVVFNLLLTRSLGADLYGIFAFANSLVMSLLLVSSFGANKSVLKFIPEYEDDKSTQNDIFGLTVISSLLGCSLIGGTLYLFSGVITSLTLEDPLLVPALEIFSLILIVLTFVEVIKSSFRAMEIASYPILIDKILRPTVYTFAAAATYVLSLSLYGFLLSFLFSVVLLFAVSLLFFIRKSRIRPTFSYSPSRIYEYYNYSLPVSLKDAASILYTRVDVLMVGVLLSSSSVGVYNVVVLVSSIIAFPLSAINQLFPPIASKLYSSDQKPTLNAVYKIVTRWSFTASLFLAAYLITFRDSVLQLFGSNFTTGATILILLAIAKLISGLVGPSGYVLMMSNHQYLVLCNQVTVGVLNTILNYVLIVKYGIVGAAIATALSLSVINLIRIAEVYHMEGLFPYSKAMLKPAVSGVFGLVAMYGVKTLMGNTLSLLFGGVFGFGVYLAGLVVLGLEDAEVRILDNVLPEKGTNALLGYLE
ncbi:flippase [Halostella sp. PRR32]|uniref:flippase n=1 Tax=Halostella sp. PRR32 TaxID=3098147 RepID=UPI002B1D1235|nr:flippase [Halostella sp. PRR32]